MKLWHTLRRVGSIGVMSAVVAVSVVSVFQAFAQGGITPARPINESTLNARIDIIVNWVFGLLLVVAVLYILWAGFLFLQSGGKEEDITKAKKYIQYAIIAIVVAALAKAIVAIIKSLLDIQDGGVPPGTPPPGGP